MKSKPVIVVTMTVMAGITAVRFIASRLRPKPRRKEPTLYYARPLDEEVQRWTDPRWAKALEQEERMGGGRWMP